MKIRLYLLGSLITAPLLLNGCDSPLLQNLKIAVRRSLAAQSKGPILVTVNGQPITQADVDAYRKTMAENVQQYYSTSKGTQEILDVLITRKKEELLAKKLKIYQSKEYLEGLPLVESELINRILTAEFDRTNAIQDAELRKAYSSWQKDHPSVFITVAYALFKKKNHAASFESNLKDKAPFEKAVALAKRQKLSIIKSGVHPPFEIGQPAEEWLKAAALLRKLEMTDPIRSSEGYYVFQTVEESTQTSTVPYERILPTVTAKVRRTNYQKWVEEKLGPVTVEKAH